jgi:hypothetical protein
MATSVFTVCGFATFRRFALSQTITGFRALVPRPEKLRGVYLSIFEADFQPAIGSPSSVRWAASQDADCQETRGIVSRDNS